MYNFDIKYCKYYTKPTHKSGIRMVKAIHF